VSSLEKECQQKDAVISQLHHQLEALQHQHASDAARLVHPTTDVSNTDVRQKQMQLEIEIRTRRLEVEALQTKVFHAVDTLSKC